ncbi:MAG: peptide chain release factor N(5)-glutamine methyltransferase [Pyrinomonadaceae bacterium]
MTDQQEQNISAAITAAAAKLQAAGVEDARREASSLLAFVLDRESVFLIAHPEYELSGDETQRFAAAIERRANREPFHYIVGKKEFYGLEFIVAPGVLIPRPETELLVEDAIKLLSGCSNPHFLEIGVGSGCISVSILHNVPNATAIGVDISETALSIAAANANQHNVANRLILTSSNVYESVDVHTRFDLIVSNPPYIPDSDLPTLQSEVREFEPHSALFGGNDGLNIVRRIVSDAPRFLKIGGHILIEIGFGQAASVKELFDGSIWDEIGFIRDLQGIERHVKAKFRG